MNRVVKHVLIGSAFAFGLALRPVAAQHGGHGDDGNHKHGQTEPAAAALPNCPVMDEPINLAVSIATDEGPVFFCCKECIPKYQADPAKYATSVAAQRRAMAARTKIQVTCPVSRDPADPEVFVESGGRKVFFCCKGCVNKYRANPAKFASALANGYTYQTKCPVTKEEIHPKSFTTAGNGMKVFFCCKGCSTKFFADPAKYSPDLVAQGFTVNPKEMAHDIPPAEQGQGHDAHDAHDHDH
jgi:YHS domain-containing protein